MASPLATSAAPARASTTRATRFQAMKNILDRGEYFKVVCGAGNEDPDEVYRLSLVYTLAGALGIDVSAHADVVRASVRGIERAAALAPSLGRSVSMRPFITVSVGLRGDPHARKARIADDACVACGACYERCDQFAIDKDPYRIIAGRCIGCGRCADACPSEAVHFYTRKVDLRKVVPECLAAGAESLELHAVVPDDEVVLRDWRIINEILPHQFVSLCLDRSRLSNHHLVERVRRARDVAGERLIIQADGAPMSGGADDFNTTLSSVDCAAVIRKSKVPVRILLSGGTNSRTGELAALCGVDVNGVSIGTFARNLVREEIQRPDLDEDSARLARAVAKARRLVETNIDRIRRD